MVQMGDILSVERAISSLNKLQIYDGEIQLSYSKQQFLNDIKQPFDLADGTPSFKDYIGNRNNRFTNPDSANKNRNPMPADVLHFFNAPFGITESEVTALIEKNCSSARPIKVSLFPSKSKSNCYIFWRFLLDEIYKNSSLISFLFPPDSRTKSIWFSTVRQCSRRVRCPHSL